MNKDCTTCFREPFLPCLVCVYIDKKSIEPEDVSRGYIGGMFLKNTSAQKINKNKRDNSNF